MPRYVAFLRAINVGGRFIKMAALKSHFESLGCSNVKTFINTGNVSLSSPLRSGDELAADLEQTLPPLLGFESHVFVRSLSEFQAIAERATAMMPQVSGTGEVNVLFLAKPFSAAEMVTLMSLHNEYDDFERDGREVYWRCQVGQSTSAFSNALFERKLKMRTTIRRASMLAGFSTAISNEFS